MRHPLSLLLPPVTVAGGGATLLTNPVPIAVEDAGGEPAAEPAR